MSAHPAPHPPTIAGYVVHEHLGSGGSGDVWRAVGPQGDVAIKVLRPGQEMGGRAEWRRLRRHAGPHVVEALDLQVDAEARTCLVLQLMRGGSLESIVKGRGGLTVGECVTAVAPVAGVLHGLHEAGSEHGDVAPGNVLFDEEGKPALIDLGASRALAVSGPAQWATPAFAAPEIIDGEEPSSAADVYSLGALLWFCLVGDAPAPASLRPWLPDLVDIPATLRELVLACLSQTPSARPTAREVRDRLSEVEAAQPVPVDASPRLEDEGVPADLTITRRLREEAQRRQREQIEPQRRERRRATPTVRIGMAIGVALVVGACLAPVDGDDPEPAAPAGKPVALARATQLEPAPGTRQSTAKVPVAGPSEAQINALLACRAAAWNTLQVKRLEGCLVPGSRAMAQDEKALGEAISKRIRYEAISYRARKPAGMQCDDREHRCSAVSVTTGSYVVHQSGRTQQPQRRDDVMLELQWQGEHWRISSWTVR